VLTVCGAVIRLENGGIAEIAVRGAVIDIRVEEETPPLMPEIDMKV